MKKWGERLNRVEQLAQSFRSNPLTSRYKPRLWPCQPSSVWKLFPRQSMAISFAQTCKEVTSRFIRAALFQQVALLIFRLVCLVGERIKILISVPFLHQIVHVFALEKENSPPGQRIYLVTSYSELWHYYR